jgi:hypothetical protein
MPKTAARLWLQITGIRVERLQTITEDDAKAEGVERWIEERMRSKPEYYKIYYREPGDIDSHYCSTAQCSFETLWRSINGPESWDANPYVWVIEFKVISKTGKP